MTSRPPVPNRTGPPTSVFVYGSCVTRDTFSTLPTAEFTLRGYVARQSLISATAGDAGPLDLSGLESKFQRRMLAGDVAGDLGERLSAQSKAIDLLLWDLADERLGVLVAPDGRTVTRTVEAIKTGLPHVRDWTLVEFGSDEHFTRWAAALRLFCTQLDALGLTTRTALLAIPWATATDAGQPAPDSFGIGSADANARYRRYYREAESVGFPVLGLPERSVLASVSHQWGLAPFHYDGATYAAIGDLIRSHVAEPPQKREKAGT